jgi:hypothetical protein
MSVIFEFRIENWIRFWLSNLKLPYVLKSLTSEPTQSATPFFKRAYKISHPPRLLVSWVDLPSFATSSKIWPNFSNKVFLHLKLSKNHLNKKCAPNQLSFKEKKIQKDSDEFWHRKFTLKVQFLHFAMSWQS